MAKLYEYRIEYQHLDSITLKEIIRIHYWCTNTLKIVTTMIKISHITFFLKIILRVFLIENTRNKN